MTILTISKKNTIKLPKEVSLYLRGAKHLQVRLSASGITLTPVQIQPAADLKAIPDR